MDSATLARVLVVTDRVVTTPDLLDSIRARAARGPSEFRVLVPNPSRSEWSPTDPGRHANVGAAEVALAVALPLIEAAAGGAVRASVSIRHDPMDAIEESLLAESSDEVMLAVAPHDVERRLHIDLPHRLAHLGMALTVVTTDLVAVPA